MKSGKDLDVPIEPEFEVAGEKVRGFGGAWIRSRELKPPTQVRFIGWVRKEESK